MEPGQTEAIYDVDEEHERRLREEMAEANRRMFPWTAARLDELRAVFGPDCKVVYFRENGEERGERPDPSDGLTVAQLGIEQRSGAGESKHLRSDPPRRKRR